MRKQVLAVFAVLGIGALPSGAGAGSLFTENGPEIEFTIASDDAESVDWIRARPVQIDEAAIDLWSAEGTLELKLFDDVVLRAEYVADEDDPDGLAPAGIVWRELPTGEIFEDGTAVIVREGEGKIYGSIFVHGAVYEVLPTNSPLLHVVVERPAERDLACGTADKAVEGSSDGMAAAAAAAAGEWPPPVELKDWIIRVLMVQTAESAHSEWQGVILFSGVDYGELLRRSTDSAISAAFRRARLALTNSGTQARIVSVTPQPLKLKYSERPYLEQDLHRLTNNALDGHIAGLRDQYRADVVFLWRKTDDGSACGVAWQNYGSASPNRAFAVGAHTCFERVFAHELGHLLSAQHDFLEEGMTPGHFMGDRAFGYLAPFKGGGFLEWMGVGMNTVMAYDGSCGRAGFPACMRINYFSTPTKVINGSAIGKQYGTYSAPGADNVSAINSTWRTVANYRQ